MNGVMVLDPLGDRVLEISRALGGSRADSIADRVKPAHEVVRQQLMRAEVLKDDKLIPRYRALLEYFDDRACRGSRAARHHRQLCRTSFSSRSCRSRTHGA
jgi:hypothetical protein